VFEVDGFEYTVEPLPVGPGATADELDAAMQQALHDCPECRAARARGEQPMMISGAELLRELESVRGVGPGLGFKRPRWRDLKKRVRRG
jgi:hypothetical protein